MTVDQSHSEKNSLNASARRPATSAAMRIRRRSSGRGEADRQAEGADGDCRQSEAKEQQTAYLFLFSVARSY
jgi:hypothetical protein